MPGTRRATYPCRVVAANAEYRGTVALRQVIMAPPADVTALALTCWEDSFSLHGVQPLPTPLPSGPLPPLGKLVAITDTGSRHQSGGSGGHGHPRFMWHTRFESGLSPATSSLTLSGATGTEAIQTLIQLPQWPPARFDAPTHTMAAAALPATLRLDRAGRTLPDRVVPLSADLGVIAGIRRALTSLYCWPSWFLMTVEAAGAPLPVTPGVVHKRSWEMEDDQGNRYLGHWIGGWSGQDNGAHIGFAPGLDPEARQVRVSFTDPFGRAGQLNTTVAVPNGEPSP